MRKFETKTETVTKSREVLVKCTCDICGAEGGPWDDNYKSGEFCEVNVSIRKGSRYPSGGWDETLYFDVCPDCFNRCVIRLFPVPPHKKESDW